MPTSLFSGTLIATESVMTKMFVLNLIINIMDYLLFFFNVSCAVEDNHPDFYVENKIIPQYLR